MTAGEVGNTHSVAKETKPPLGSRIGRDSPFLFGQRYLHNEEEVFNYNAWDNVEWGEEQIRQAESVIESQRENPVNDLDRQAYNSNPAKYWDIFYKNNRDNFFKDRQWLQIEFPSLYEYTSANYEGPATILEVGCGAGNTFFPLLHQNKNPNLKLYGCDYLKVSINIIEQNEIYQEAHRNGIAYASVWDLASEENSIPENLEPNSVDVVVMVFVFLALHPDQWAQAVHNLYKILKPGGEILFRDYGRYDLAQVRFKKGRLLQDNFYIRGDGTRVYFFTEEELRDIFSQKGHFQVDKIASDRRLLVNRKRQLKMYRNWIQAVLTKN